MCRNGGLNIGDNNVEAKKEKLPNLMCKVLGKFLGSILASCQPFVLYPRLHLTRYPVYFSRRFFRQYQEH